MEDHILGKASRECLGDQKNDDIDEVVRGEGFNIQTCFPSKVKATNFSNGIDIDNIEKSKLGKKRRTFFFFLCLEILCFRKKDAIKVDISQKALEFLDCHILGKAVATPRKKFHGRGWGAWVGPPPQP